MALHKEMTGVFLSEESRVIITVLLDVSCLAPDPSDGILIGIEIE